MRVQLREALVQHLPFAVAHAVFEVRVAVGVGCVSGFQKNGRASFGIGAMDTDLWSNPHDFHGVAQVGERNVHVGNFLYL